MPLQKNSGRYFFASTSCISRDVLALVIVPNAQEIARLALILQLAFSKMRKRTCDGPIWQRGTLRLTGPMSKFKHIKHFNNGSGLGMTLLSESSAGGLLIPTHSCFPASGPS